MVCSLPPVTPASTVADGQIVGRWEVPRAAARWLTAYLVGGWQQPKKACAARAGITAQEDSPTPRVSLRSLVVVDEPAVMLTRPTRALRRFSALTRPVRRRPLRVGC